LTREFRLQTSALLGLLALTLLPASAVANHNKGVPHYGYFENYPQVPVEEFVAVDGRWEISATLFNFQGLDRSLSDTPNDVKIYLALYDLERGQGYAGPLRVEIRQGATLIAKYDRLRPDEEAVYSTRETLPRSGDYELVALLASSELTGLAEQRVVLPFSVELSGEGVNWWIVAMLTVPAVAIFALALLGRGRGKRRRFARRLARDAAVPMVLLMLCVGRLSWRT
jgi:hypothetical protein